MSVQQDFMSKPFQYVRFILVAIAASVAGCTHSSSEAVTSLPAELQADAMISSIQIKSLPDDVPASFSATLTTALQTATSRCAAGRHPLRLEVSVTKYKPQNLALTMLVGSSNDIEGSAQLVEPATGTVVGDYDIVRSTGGGGLVGMAVMAGAEGQMAQAFATDLCRKAFGRDPA
jgi:hypothetical protein